MKNGVADKNRVMFTGLGVVGALVLAYAGSNWLNRPTDLPIGSAANAATLVQPGQVFVQVAGAVAKPGLYRLKDGARIDDAIKAAGGFTKSADTSRVNLAEKLIDGTKITVPGLGDTEDSIVTFLPKQPTSPSATKKSGPRPTTTAKAQPGLGSVSLNSASQAELETLPGIGPRMAQSIIAYRIQKGGFKTIEELDNVKGIGPKKLASFRKFLKL